MALKAGYVGVKKNDATKLSQMPGITDIGTGLELDDDGELSVTGATKTIEGNPEGSATETLTKLQIGDDIFSIPGNDNSKCYQTDDATESAIVDADYIPFLDSSAASGAGAPRKSTWSNFKTKLKAVFDELYQGVLTAGKGIDITLSTISIKGDVIAAETDLDDIVDTGIYFLRGSSDVSNIPPDLTSNLLYAPLVVLQNQYSSDVRQIIYRHNGTIYMRGKTGSPAVWGSWYKFTGTVVTAP